MIDLHIHFLPGIDDGAIDLEEAVRMCRLAARDGCETLVATPHQRNANWRNNEPERLEALRQTVQAAVGERPQLQLGAEIRVDSDLLDELDNMPGSGLLPLAGSSYLLLEFPRQISFPDPEGLMHELKLLGWKPILAHPEFIPFLADQPEVIQRLVDIGVLFQVTAASITGDFGRKAQEMTGRMLRNGQVHFVASDAHGVEWRPPGLQRAFASITALMGKDTAVALTRENPMAVVENRPLPKLQQALRN